MRLLIGPAPDIPIGRAPQVSVRAPVVARLLEVESRRPAITAACSPSSPFGDSTSRSSRRGGAPGRHALDQGSAVRTVGEVVAGDLRPIEPDERHNAATSCPPRGRRLEAVLDGRQDPRQERLRPTRRTAAQHARRFERVDPRRRDRPASIAVGGSLERRLRYRRAAGPAPSARVLRRHHQDHGSSTTHHESGLPSIRWSTARREPDGKPFWETIDPGHTATSSSSRNASGMSSHSHAPPSPRSARAGCQSR